MLCSFEVIKVNIMEGKMDYNNRLGTAKALCEECYRARMKAEYISVTKIVEAINKQTALQARMKVM